jgi:hypothetical protein
MTEQKVFNNSLAEAISKTDPKTSYVSTLIATWFMIIGIAAFMIFLGFFEKMSGWLKTISLFNMFFMLLFMYANLVVTYQQYRSYKEAKAIQDEIMKVQQTIDMKVKQANERKNG